MSTTAKKSVRFKMSSCIERLSYLVVTAINVPIEALGYLLD